MGNGYGYEDEEGLFGLSFFSSVDRGIDVDDGTTIDVDADAGTGFGTGAGTDVGTTTGVIPVMALDGGIDVGSSPPSS